MVRVVRPGRIVSGLDGGQGGSGGGDVRAVLSIHNGVGVGIERGRGVEIFLSGGAQGSGGGKDAVDSSIAQQNQGRV